MNKQNIWFITLFSLIIVLSIYYITMPSDLMIQSNEIKNEETEKEVINDVEESTILVSLRIEAEEEYLKEMESLKSVLASNDSTINEKNNALRPFCVKKNTQDGLFLFCIYFYKSILAERKVQIE